MNQEPITKPSSLNPEVFTSLPQIAQDYIRGLENYVYSVEKHVVSLMTQMQGFVAKVQELEARLAKDSSNSSKPPSSDGLGKKPKTSSLRGKSGKKPGGQPGHTGRTLEQISNPDNIEIHSPETCDNCQKNLFETSTFDIEKRQVFDLPEVAVEVTEHRAEIKLCPCCGHKNKGMFPENVKAPVQYGERVRSLAAYFEHQHLIPFERLTQIFEDLYGIFLSQGTCHNIDKKLFKNLASFESNLKAHLLACNVLNFDETGARCEKKLHWIHVTSSTTATFYGIHEKRGQEALDDFDILPRFTGTAVHDHWFPYFAYTQVKHGLCNAHHLRELKYVFEQEKAEWAKKMETFLHKANKAVNQAKAQGKSELKIEEVELIHQKYAQIILEGAQYYQGLSDLTNEGMEPLAEGQIKSGFKLLRRLLRKMDAVLAFIHDFRVPFTNNEAEQEIRMQKVKQKISGCFRSFKGGVISCRIRSYIATARKQGWKILESLAEAIRGSPRLLPVIDTGN
jgi:transposase